MRYFGPSSHYYEPPEPRVCCPLYFDDEEHDVVACFAEQAEEAAERRAEWLREECQDRRYWNEP